MVAAAAAVAVVDTVAAEEAVTADTSRVGRVGTDRVVVEVVVEAVVVSLPFLILYNSVAHHHPNRMAQRPELRGC